MDIDMDKIVIDTIKWSAPEYSHKEHSNDWFWAIGLIILIGSGLAVWFRNYVFAIFIFLAGASVVMFSIREPKEINFLIEKKGITAGRDFFSWKNIKSFNIKNEEENLFAKLIIETDKHFLPIYTFPIPKEYIDTVKENMLKVVQPGEIKESQSMAIAEKIGF